MVLVALASISNYSQDNRIKIAQNRFHKTKIKSSKVFIMNKSKPVRQEFEAIFAKQITDYKAQFETVKRGEKLKPDCAPDFILRNLNGDRNL